MHAVIAATAFLASLAAAAPTATPPPFGLIAAHSDSPIHLQAIDANDLLFYIGKPTVTFCPTGVQGIDCSTLDNSTTAFDTGAAYGKAGGLSLDTIVPGGQTVYVAKNGALSFTEAHGDVVPAGAHANGFVLTAPGSNGLGSLTFKGAGATGFVACQVGGAEGPYQVFANVAGQDFSKCIGFDALSSAYTGPAAWQFD